MAILSVRTPSSIQLLRSSVSPICSKPLFRSLSNFSSSIVSAPFARLKSNSPISRPRVVLARASTGVADPVADYREDIGEILGDVSIFTASGQPVKFSNLLDQNDVCIFANYLLSKKTNLRHAYNEFLWFSFFWIRREFLLLCFWGISDAFAGKLDLNTF